MKKRRIVSLLLAAAILAAALTGCANLRVGADAVLGHHFVQVS